MTLAPVARPIVLAWGSTRALLALLAGAASTLALEPFVVWPVMFVTFPVLVWLIDGVVARSWRGLATAAAIGWWFGFGYFFAGLYWLGFALLVDAETFAVFLPLAVVGVPAGLALFTAAGVALARLLWTRGATRILTLAAALTLSEWLRGHILTGFPWNVFGYALTAHLALAQSAALVGIWMLNLFAVAIFASPAVLADDPEETPHRWLAPTCAALVLAGLAAYGAARLALTPTSFVEGANLRIVQPNLQQDAKFDYSAKQSVMSRYLSLSARVSGPASTGLAGVTHLVWPESAFPFFLSREPDALADIAALLPPGAVLMTGAVRPGEVGADGSITRAYNSLYVIDHDGSILSVYDKVHLVPFGEFLPFQDFLEQHGLTQLTKVQGGFLPGDRHRPLLIPRAPRFLPLICYEIIFPGEAVPRGNERPGWIVNVTNDGWFGTSPGPYQHFQQARIRTIEEGLPLVRAANTGISAVVDPLGRIIAALPLGVEGVLDSKLPQPVPPTPYSRLGERHTFLVLAAILLLTILRRSRRPT